MLIKNDRGQKSWSLTLAVSAFFVTTLVILVSCFDELFGFRLKGVDSTLVIGYLTSSLGLYGFRRRKDAAHKPDVDKE